MTGRRSVRSAFRFRTLQARILVFFLTLLLVVQSAAFVAVITANRQFVREQIEDDLRVTGRIFHRFVHDKVEQIMLGATLLSGDFAFKQAFAGGDHETLLSAAQNLQRNRIGADVIMIIDPDDYSVMVDTSRPDAAAQPFALPGLIEAAEDGGHPTSSIGSLDGQLFRLGIVPLLAPEPVAWIAVGFLIDDEFAREFHRLASTELSFTRETGAGSWPVVASTLPPGQRRGLEKRAREWRAARVQVRPLTLVGERFVALGLPLGNGIRVVLQRSLDMALRPFQRLYRILGLLMGAGLAMSVIAVVLIARGITRPIRDLAEGTRRVATGDYRHQIATTRQDEIGQLANAFNRMTRGLAAFQRYVPTELVRTLIAKGIESKPEALVATMLFTDIQGFTRIAEKLPPERVVTILNEYFSVVTGPIERYGGVVTQYQGDAMLAVFNVPAQNPEHAANAVRAAIAIQAALSNRTFAGSITLVTRIGINTGRVVAGSVGSEERVNYTVHGDAVNLAARLQDLNKIYDSRILIAQGTEALIGPELPREAIGEVTIEGKREQVMVYKVG